MEQHTGVLLEVGAAQHGQVQVGLTQVIITVQVQGLWITLVPQASIQGVQILHVNRDVGQHHSVMNITN